MLPVTPTMGSVAFSMISTRAFHEAFHRTGSYLPPCEWILPAESLEAVLGKQGLWNDCLRPGGIPNVVVMTLESPLPFGGDRLL